jgi:hypothetical protein
MLRKGFDKSVINLHELTNGLIKYHHPILNQFVLGKPNKLNSSDLGWGYYQSLKEVVDLLDSVDHYKTSRLAHYHIIKRKDSLSDQLSFYEYLNRNFYIISGRRDNLLEHALSWEITAHSKHLNVYNIDSKIKNFESIYNNGILASKETFISHLNRYKEYIDWSNRYFNIQSIFNYDLNIQNIEDYILNLDFMSGHTNNSWGDMFGQKFNTWNLCHRLLPNLAIREKTYSTNKELPILTNSHMWDVLKGSDWPNSSQQFEEQKDNLPLGIKQEIINKVYTSLKLTETEYTFLKDNIKPYQLITNQINELVDNGFLVDGVPIKLQSLSEKQSIFKNFEECIIWYNDWVNKNNFGTPYSLEQLNEFSKIEESNLLTPLIQFVS